MNDIKENIVILNRFKYDELKEDIKDLQNELDLKEKLYNVFEEYFWEDFYNKNRYIFVEMEETNFKDYNFEKLLTKVLALGITDVKYITNKIIEYKEKYTEKGEKNE